MNYRRRDLIKSAVRFDERTHSYTNTDKQALIGVTSLIKRMIPELDKLGAVDPEILRAKAERGTRIHQIVQDELMKRMSTDSRFSSMDKYPEVNHLILDPEDKMKPLVGRRFIDDEYLVSNDTSVATMLDLIDNELNIYDIKTTRVLDRDYLSWQLSLGAYLFDKQNERMGLRSAKLYALWLTPDAYDLVEIPRKPIEEVEELIRAYESGDTFVPAVNQSVEIATIEDYEERIINLKQMIDAFEKCKADSLAKIETAMRESGTKSLSTERMKLTLVEPSTSLSFDSKRFEKDHPELFAEYKTKETTRKGYVKISLRNNTQDESREPAQITA